MYQYAYLVLDLILGVIWLVVFLKRKDLRQEQIFVSVLCIPVAPIAQILWFYHDYWRPEYFFTFYINGVPIGIEESLFLFFAGGIGSVIYEFLINKGHRRGKKNYPILIFSIISCFLILAMLKSYFGLNTIWASTVSMFLVAVFLLSLNFKMWKDFAWSGVLMMLIAFFSYSLLLLVYPDLFNKLWVDGGLSGFNVLRVPIEELAWFLAWGMCSGVIYESWISVKAYPSLVKIRK